MALSIAQKEAGHGAAVGSFFAPHHGLGDFNSGARGVGEIDPINGRVERLDCLNPGEQGLGAGDETGAVERHAIGAGETPVRRA